MITINSDITTALAQIRATTGPITAEFNLPGGGVFELIALANALKAHPHPVTARVTGLASIIPLTGADHIEMGDNATLLILPLHMVVTGEFTTEQMRALNEATATVHTLLARWPEVAALFIKGDEYFMEKAEAKALGIVQ